MSLEIDDQVNLGISSIFARESNIRHEAWQRESMRPSGGPSAGCWKALDGGRVRGQPGWERRNVPKCGTVNAIMPRSAL
ncbi:hypothetical protein GCM10010182_07720 [Actinomadura cremea]|nr:hypothetical protein GCM10010182_07720 [Actinomadura cremea]